MATSQSAVEDEIEQTTISAQELLDKNHETDEILPNAKDHMGTEDSLKHSTLNEGENTENGNIEQQEISTDIQEILGGEIKEFHHRSTHGGTSETEEG